MNWKHGYFAESGYTYGFYEETTPARLKWVAALKGYEMRGEGFRYIDLGCGQGFCLIQMAALHPEAQFVGVDFIPDHIAHASNLARTVGLSNVQFVEGDFIELARDFHALGKFDYAVSHGISSWISPDVRQAMFSLAQSVLKPGGVMYNSYNTYPGWLHDAPFQNLVLQSQKRTSGKQALEEATSLINALAQSGSPIKSSLPGLEARLESMAKQDPAYLEQEYNHQWWRPVFSNEMLDIAQAHKLNFLASATLSEVFDGNYPVQLMAIIRGQQDSVAREAIRDLAIYQSFRRDIYIKGGLKYWPIRQLDYLRQQRFVANGMKALPPEGEKFTWSVGTLKVSGKRDAYSELIDTFGSQGKSIDESMAELKRIDLSAMLQQVSLLLQGGWLALQGPGNDAAVKLNQTVASAVSESAPYQYLCTPGLSSAIAVTYFDFLLMNLNRQINDPFQLEKALLAAMQRLNKRFTKGGKAIDDPAETKAQAAQTVKGYLNERKPHYQRFGAL